MKPTEAMAIAERAHEDQRYGDGPYFDHVKDVVWRVSQDPRSTPDALVVAWLHDVVEDTAITMDDLIGTHGLTGAAREAVKAITREPEEDYGKYLSRVCKDPLASLVKLHDLTSNLAAGARPALTERYTRALPFVHDALLGVVYCKSQSCRAPIVYLRTKSGKYMPVNRDSLPREFDREALVFDRDVGHESHYATCPDAKRFRRAR